MERKRKVLQARDQLEHRHFFCESISHVEGNSEGPGVAPGKGVWNEVTREVEWEQMMQNFTRQPDLSSHQNGFLFFFFF